MRYNVGDKVKVKDLYWYNTNCDENGVVDCGDDKFIASMMEYCGKTFTIASLYHTGYKLVETDIPWTFNDEMLEDMPKTQKESLIDLACEWFEDLDFEMVYFDSEGLFDKEKFIQDFRKIMQAKQMHMEVIRKNKTPKNRKLIIKCDNKTIATVEPHCGWYASTKIDSEIRIKIMENLYWLLGRDCSEEDWIDLVNKWDTGKHVYGVPVDKLSSMFFAGEKEIALKSFNN